MRLHEAARRALEEWMGIRDYEYEHELSLKYFDLGFLEGAATAKAAVLLKIFLARGLELTELEQNLLLGFRGGKKLDGWIDSALQTRTPEEAWRLFFPHADQSLTVHSILSECLLAAQDARRAAPTSPLGASSCETSSSR